MAEYRSQIKPLYGSPINRSHWASSGLVGNWLFNEGSGLIAHDDSGNGNHGVLTGMAPMSATSGWVPSINGGTLAFDAINDKVIIPNHMSLDNWTELTIIVRFKAVPSMVRYARLIEKGDNTEWAIIFNIFDNDNKITVQKLGTGSPALTSTNILANNNWYVIAITITSSAYISLYVDGYYDKSFQDAMPADKTHSITIGDYSSGAHLFNGSISYVSIRSRAVSPSEIAYLHQFPYCMYEDQAGMQAWLYQQQQLMFRRGMTARTGARF